MQQYQQNLDLGEIQEEADESESNASREEKFIKPTYPNLFDFRFNNKYYIPNIKIDEKGERIKTNSNM